MRRAKLAPAASMPAWAWSLRMTWVRLSHDLVVLPAPPRRCAWSA